MPSHDQAHEHEEDHEGHEANEHEHSKKLLITLAVWLFATLIVGQLLFYFYEGIPLGFKLPLTNYDVTVALILYYVSVIPCALYIGVAGIKELVLERRFSVEFLMAVAGLGALFINALPESSIVLSLYFKAEYFEDYIQDRARRTVEKLSKFMPDRAHVIIEGKEKDAFVNAVDPGVVLLVRPGERIPLDGNVVDGFSHVDQALVTGESVPVPKRVNDSVYGGTLNKTGPLKIVVTKRSSETLVSRIVELVIESGKRKASMEKFIDRFAKIYVPIVLIIAVITAVGIPLLFGDFQLWFYRSLTLIVISCPSAFIISVPATIFLAITIAAKRGVIIKGGVFIEKLAKVKTVVFDKTGTLTLGRPAVHEVKKVNIAQAEDEAIAYAAALDQFSTHPVGQAIVRRAVGRGIDLAKFKVSDVIEIPGKGIVGIVNDRHVAIGNLELMKEYECDCTEAFEIISKELHTAVCISVGKTGLAAVCVTDEIRQDALKAIKTLKQLNIQTVMLTGDKKDIAQETGAMLGIDKVNSQLFPEDKLRIVDELKQTQGLVAMVGDGVNDAPALASSDVGIAMGARGVDVALESADIVLVNDELAQIPYLIRLSNKTMGIAKQNIAGSLIVKFVLGALGLAGITPLWFTVAAGDDGVTMLLLLNSLRLERLK